MDEPLGLQHDAVRRQFAVQASHWGTDAIDDEPDLDARYNHLERLRDPSHTRALTRGGLRALFTDAGLAVDGDHARDVDNELEPWLDRSRTPDAARGEILAAIAAELAGGVRTGMRPKRSEDGRLWFLHRWNVLIAPKA